MNETPFRLDGKTAVVTGAGRGIGRTIAATLARAGAAVAVADFDPDLGREAAEALARGGHRAEFVAVDVRDPDAVERMTAEVVAAFGGVDVLVNNAGIAENTPSEEVARADWLRVIDVNLNGVFWCCQAVGRRMLAAGGGAIVNIASMSGLVANRPQPQAAYNASKAGVIMLTTSLAAEWADRGVRVNAVSPGYIGTEMTRLGMSREGWKEAWLAATPQGRVGEPQDVAHAVLYLASDEARFATGTNLVVDGGYTAW